MDMGLDLNMAPKVIGPGCRGPKGLLNKTQVELLGFSF